ncbi:MAG: hypothetical protein FD180_4811 [Planctomycetota bacterium]|nr:MAG: hypothetical protein FD180_4811 [Planctomycetota bacterium]
MKWVVPALVFALAGGLAVADGGGTTVEKGKVAEKPAGNPNKAEPGLAELGWKSYDATYVPVKDWTMKVMHGGYAAVASKNGNQVLPLPVKDKDGVAVKGEQFAIEVDGNHDGKMDERIKTDGDMCVVSVVYADGTIAPYAVRFQKGGGGTWNWQRSGFWMATINKTQLGVLDNNNNGKYDENGEDAVSVGLTGYATPLSDVVSLGGTLYNLKVEENGKKLWVKEYDGETGKLDARSGHKSMGMLGSAMFQKGHTYIDICTIKDKAAVVPAGSYEFFGGECKAPSGGQSALMRKGNMVAVEVKKDDTTKVAWGMDLKIDFDFDISGGTVSILVSTLHVYGGSGEEYYQFTPPAFMPVVQVFNPKGEQAQKGSMAMC